MRDYQIIDNCQPQKWEESVPIGCGRMGATIMCGAGEETLYLNEESIWSSRPGGEANPQMPEKIQAVRELLLRGKAVEANRMAKEILYGYITRIRSYEGAGCLKICLHESTRISEYRHSLDLVNGIASIEYMRETTEYKREYFASWPDQVIACRITASGAPIHAEIVYEHVRLSSLQAGNREILASARTAFGGHEFCVRVRVETDGEVLADHGHLFVENTSSLCVYISIATQFRFGVRFMEAAVFPECLDYEKLRARHMEDFRVLMSRADLSLPETEGMKEIPMTERLRTLLLDQVDDGNLVALQWQFSRYMLISTSRPGTLPTNLQGLWTKGNIAEWSSDYHLIPLAEDFEFIENIDEILSVEGLEIVNFGPVDFALSKNKVFCGMDMPEIVDALTTIIEKCRAKNISVMVPGIPPTYESVKSIIDMGANMLAVGTDIMHFNNGLRTVKENVVSKFQS